MSEHDEPGQDDDLEQAFAQIALRTAKLDQAAAELAEWAPVVAQGVASYRHALLVQDVPADEALHLTTAAQSEVIAILFQAVTSDPPAADVGED